MGISSFIESLSSERSLGVLPWALEAHSLTTTRKGGQPTNVSDSGRWISRHQNTVDRSVLFEGVKCLILRPAPDLYKPKCGVVLDLHLIAIFSRELLHRGVCVAQWGVGVQCRPAVQGFQTVLDCSHMHLSFQYGLLREEYLRAAMPFPMDFPNPEWNPWFWPLPMVCGFFTTEPPKTHVS